jgi:hypothetical protein
MGERVPRMQQNHQKDREMKRAELHPQSWDENTRDKIKKKG